MLLPTTDDGQMNQVNLRRCGDGEGISYRT